MEILQQPNESVLINSSNTSNEDQNKLTVEQQTCIFHPNEKIIYLNTNLNDKRILACYLCITSERLNSKQLLPLIHLSNNDEIFKTFWGFQDNKEALDTYNSVKSLDLKESREDILKKSKDLRDTLNSQLDELESQLLFENDLKQSLLLNTQSIATQFADKITNQINQFKTNEKIVENNLRGCLFGIEQMKPSVQEQVKLMKQFNINEQQKGIKQLLCKNLNMKVLKLKEDNQQHEKTLLNFFNKSSEISGDVFSKMNPILKDQNIVYEKKQTLLCKECKETTIEAQLKIPFISIPDIPLSKDLRVLIFFKDSFLKEELMLYNIPFTQQDITQAVFQYANKDKLDRLLIEINGQIIRHSEIIDNSKVKSLKVFEVPLYGKEEENILIKVNFCKKSLLICDLSQPTGGLFGSKKQPVSQQQSQISIQQQQNSQQQPQQSQEVIKQQQIVSNPSNNICLSTYLSVNKNIIESDLVNQIIEKSVLFSNIFFYGFYGYKPIYGKDFTIKLESSKDLDKTGKNTLFSSQGQNKTPQVFVTFEQFQHNLQVDSQKNTRITQIQQRIPLNFIQTRIQNNILEFKEKSNILYCCNCSKIQTYEQSEKYNLENQEALIFDYSSINKYFATNNIQYSYFTNKIQHNSLEFKLKCIIGIIDAKQQQISYDSTIDHWTIGDEKQTTLEKERLDSMNPLLVVYQKQTQEEKKIE